MPRLQVKELLGEPYRATYRKGRHTPYVMEPREGASERDQLVRELGGLDGNWSERWQYGKFGLSDMDDLIGGSDKAFIVDFDDWGRVMGLRRPSKGPFASQTQPGKVGP